MKITCTSCSSKYTIADEKVVGRRVKVRCKNCKANILVDGTEGSGDASSEEAADVSPLLATTSPQTSTPRPAAFKPSEQKNVKKNTWSVNLSDDDSREMTTDELVQGWKNGIVTEDAYVWKDGMDDWKPVLEVPELKLRLKPLLTKPVAKSPVAAVVAPVAAPPRRGPAPPPKPRAGSTEDLFSVDFGSDKDSDVSASSLLTKESAEEKGATGSRNESSILFSLDALKTPEPAQEKPATPDIFGSNFGGGLGGTPLGGGGGLTNNLDLLTAPAQVPPPAPLGARTPPAAVAPSGKSKGGLIAAIVIGLLVVGGGAYAFLGGSGDDATAQATADAAEAAEQEAKARAEAEAAEAEKKLVEEKLKKAEEEKLKIEEQLKAAQAAAEKKEEPAPVEEEKKEPATPPSSAATSAASKPSTTTTKPATETKPAATTSAAFDTGAAKTALASAAASAASCAQAGGPTGSGKVQVTFATSGRVTNATLVSGPFAGTSVGGCIVAKFRNARVPAFSGSATTVAKSVSIQ